MKIDLKQKSSKDILEWFENHEVKASEIVELKISTDELESIGYKAFVDLAQMFFMKMLTPSDIDANSLTLRFEKLNLDSSFHKTDKSSEKYGVDSEFFTIDKTTQFSFLYHYRQALKFINIQNKKRVLNLGVNRGDEFRVIQELLSEDEFMVKEFLGIDYSASAIEYAKKDFPNSNVDFRCHDINALEDLGLQDFDLIISIGTLQSSNINFNSTFMSLYQNHLEKGGAIILGFPNCRWIDSEMIYGAKAPNYAFSELSLVLKDIHFCKKYPQQKKYRVTITGKDYLFLTARKIL
ncbi:methyltransferase domain-containing protein [Sulfurimonas sp.]|uniref:class I SAM-dependent methyltransferase n=1 Tax=Sulfurimonas sp. TaxID=2022749 RepID=UPI0025E14372|nr:methyltransferase domain-containing protein [Sulfurimonas sp.]